LSESECFLKSCEKLKMPSALDFTGLNGISHNFEKVHFCEKSLQYDFEWFTIKKAPRSLPNQTDAFQKTIKFAKS